MVPPSPGVAQILTQRDVSLRMALTIAETAIAECEKAGNNVSVAVVDRAGRLRVFLQGDKARASQYRIGAAQSLYRAHLRPHVRGLG
jgi:uncharacterized protein GlcG (DUF336 family)